jgi:glucose-specific phosphotransferase system IIA component
VHGETARYFAGDPTAGRFMASEFPIMLFGLPAAALAMYLRAPTSRRKAVGGIMLAAALTSIITGITEPIEFSFIFVAPLLYIFHVLAAFCSGLLISFFDIHLGYTFSASLIDWFLGYFNQKNSFWLFAAVGPAIAVIYFTVFYTAIGLFKYKTPGREDEAESTTAATSAAAPAISGDLQKAGLVLAALGGAANIRSIDACITRLRLEVEDSTLVNNAELKKLGASGVLKVSKNGVQVVFGVQADRLKDQIRQILKETPAPAPMANKAALIAPLKGQFVKLENVKDQTFSQKLMGDGFAILPSEGTVVAPCNAEVTNIIHTGHAIGLLGPTGAEILIHVGMDTVKMKGDGFKLLVKEGDQVQKGQKLIEFSLEKIKNAGLDTVTPVVVTNGDQISFKSLVTEPQAVNFETVVGEIEARL